MKKKSARKSAFFNPRALIGLGLCLIGLLLALLAYTSYPGASLLAHESSQPAPQQEAWQPHWEVIPDSHHDLSPPLRDLALLPMAPSREHEGPENPGHHFNHAGKDRPDPVVQTSKLLNRLTTNIPGPILNFDGQVDGVFNTIVCPDTNGYVGNTTQFAGGSPIGQYAQIINRNYEIYDKFTGASILGPLLIRSIWSGFNGFCATSGDPLGDPVVLYDKLADRWLISQLAGNGNMTPTDECIAISQTRDATGPYYRYEFHISSNYDDYPKLGSWPDAYYLSFNVYDPNFGNYLGPQPVAFDRTKMLCGLPATAITPGLVGNPAQTEDYLMPSDFDGTMLPPPGAPNSYVEAANAAGNNALTYRLWHFSVGVPFGTGMSFTQFGGPTAAPWTCLCGCEATRNCVPEQNVTNGNYLDGWGDARLMFRFAYRNFGTPSAPNESGVCTFNVSTGTQAAPRWFELKNVTNGPVVLNQEGTYAPADSVWRWLGSVAMDYSGNLALGYSVSSPTIVPGMRYTGRLSTDPLGTLPQGEATLYAGVGSQTDTNNRWGDYSSMTVDPVDDTTMWYTNEYYPFGVSSYNWHTRIGTFRINAAQPLVNVSAKSELVHGETGPFDIDLPLYAGASGPGRGVECRHPSSGTSGGKYTIVFSFTNPVTSVGGVTTSCGSATATIGSTDNRQVGVSLFAGGCNAQYITVQLNNVSDGTNTINAPVTFGLLVGDVNGNGSVNASDVALIKAQLGTACPPTFRTDVTSDGNINASDVALVQSKVGTSLPSPP
jgi:hypothetical protein